MLIRRKRKIIIRRLLPPANKFCEGYVFTPISHSVHTGGVHPPWADTPSWVDTPDHGQTHPWSPPSRRRLQRGGMHPTGLQLFNGPKRGTHVPDRPLGSATVDLTFQSLIRQHALHKILHEILHSSFLLTKDRKRKLARIIIISYCLFV